MQIHALLEQLFNQQTLTQAQSTQLFDAILQGLLSPEQLAGVLIALKVRGETIAEISGAVQALQANAQPFDHPDYLFADIVGTGGDGANTINISTAAAMVAAACGLKIAKHGNRAVSSQTGASDLLGALGVQVRLSPQSARQALDNVGLCFLFAPIYHVGFAQVAPVRQALKTRTIFNILGPLINPAKPPRQLLGVYSPKLLKVYAQTLAELKHPDSLVVCGGGLDEVALHGATQVARVRDGVIDYYELHPADFGLKTQPLSALIGGSPTQNAQHLTALLQGNGVPAHCQAVAINVAVLMQLFGFEDLKQNTEQALSMMASGQAFEVLQQLKQYQ